MAATVAVTAMGDVAKDSVAGSTPGFERTPPTSPCATAPEEMRKVPFIYCSDLFHPAMDPDDHFDLAAVFRLKEFDVKAVILDGHIDRPGQDQLTGGGRVPLEQMMEICGYRVPFAIGLKRKLLDPEDKALDDDPRFLAGVNLIIKVLRESPVPVTLKLSTGTDFAVVYNREPELVRQKVKAVYLNAGHGRGGESKEYNVTLDPVGFERVFQTGVKLYWNPCWGDIGYNNYFRIADQHVLFETCSLPLKRFFAYAFQKPDVDPIAFIRDRTEPELPHMKRDMWSPPVLAHAAGRRVYKRDEGDFLWLTPAAAKRMGLEARECRAYGYVPVRVVPISRGAIREAPKTGVLNVSFHSDQPNAQIFRQDHPDYVKIMTSCLRNLYSGD